jgi:autonomous glycyl radical cofactor GrcA
MSIETLQIHLNSEDAIKSYSSGNNYLEFNLKYFEIPSDHTIYLSVDHAVLPYSFYNVNSTNNTLCYVLNGSVVNVTFPIGNYTTTTLLNMLKSLITTLIISYSATTNKFTFSHSTLNFSFLNTFSTCFKLLGFSLNDQISSSNILISNGIVNLCSTRCICVHSTFRTDNISTSSALNSSIICSIPINVSPYSLITYSNHSNFKINLHTNIFNSVVIKLMDQNGQAIDFNNSPWSKVLQLDIVDFVN